jgi:excisionase family DNA binding protein
VADRSARKLNMEKSEKFLKTTHVAARIGIHTRTLTLWVAKKKGPPSLRLGKQLLFPEDSLEKWLASRVTGGTD